MPLDDDLPPGCVPYLPCEVDTVLAAVWQANVTPADVFVDVGSGVGRAALLVHLATGASCVGLEIQPGLVSAAQARAESLRLSRVQFLAGDAVELAPSTPGTVFFLYCPFSGQRLARLLDGLAAVAQTRSIRVCCVDMAPLDAPWLMRLPALTPRVDVYQSTLVP